MTNEKDKRIFTEQSKRKPGVDRGSTPEVAKKTPVLKRGETGATPSWDNPKLKVLMS